MDAGSSPIPFSIEPVLGWRVWRLARRENGSLTLMAVTRSDEWPAGEAARARCHAHPGRRAPSSSCSCGLYAATSPQALARSQVFTGSTSVVGAVAMWGTVVEHVQGARAETSYPARLRLACAPCLAAGRGAIEPAFVVGTTQLVAVCLRHALGASGPRASATDVQAELLSTYAVDLMPLERVSGPLKARRVNGGANPQEILVTLIGLVFQGIGYAISAVMTVLYLAWALAIVIGVVGWIISRF
jgi:hypothetical protein